MNGNHLGTDRSQRSDDNLVKNLFKVDDRTTEDLLGYIYSLSTFINYFNSEDKPDGRWNELMDKNPIIFIAYITTYSITDFDKDTGTTKDVIAKWNKKIKGWITHLFDINEDALAEKIGNLIKDAVHAYKDKFTADTGLNGSTEDLSAETERIVEDHPEMDREFVMLQYRKAILQIQNIAREYLWQKFNLKSDHTPDTALYITFVLLYKKVQDRINAIPKKHLDFYYRDILKITNRAGTPVRGIVAFELLPGVDASVIKKGIKLTAGKLFGSSTEVLFETQRTLVAYPVVPERIQTLYFNKNETIRIGTNEPVVSNIACAELVQQNQSITSLTAAIPAVFGADESTKINIDPDPACIADFGFVISSPVLFLNEGNRSIECVFFMDAVTADKILWNLLKQISKNTSVIADDAFVTIFNQAFQISYTTAKGWRSIDTYACSCNQADNSFKIILTLRKSDPPVDIYPAEADSIKWPGIKFYLNPEAPVYLYSFLSGVILDRLQINVAVVGMKNISVYNSMGKVAIDKPFDILGAAPQKNSFIMLGHSEWFKKQLNSFSVHIDWVGLPSDFGGFETYYNTYPGAYTNESFKVQSSVLSEGSWLPEVLSLSEPVNLFETENCFSPEGYSTTRLRLASTIEISAACLPEMSLDFQLADPVQYIISSQSGFIKLNLVAPDSGFGNQYYQELFTSAAMYNARNNTQIPYPNKPFVPKAGAITVDYTASDIIHFNSTGQQQPDTAGMGYFIQYTPFGLKNLWNHPYEKEQTILPAYDSEGYLILSLKGIQSGLIVSLYFHFLTASSSGTAATSSLRWEYLSGDHWNVIANNNIISDSTNGFVKSGIVQIRFPDNASGKGNPAQPYLIRISPQGAADCFPGIGCILPNAVEIICMSIDAAVIGKTVPAGSVVKSVDKLKDIKTITQAADSIGGTEAETDDVYYPRVSERIRHNSRAVTIWDYERLVLDQFNTVAVVKCTNLNERYKPVAQKVTVAVLGTQWSRQNPVYMNVDELDAIHQYLKGKANSFVTIQVKNPQVEYILVNCFVEIKSPDDSTDALTGFTGNYLADINQEIVDFISPLSNSQIGISGIGGSLIPQMLNNLIMNLPYVKSIKKLYAEHIVKNGSNTYSLGIYEGKDVIYASTPWSILLSVPQNNVVLCDDQSVDPLGSVCGIGSMEIGLDFIIPSTQDTPVHHEDSTVLEVLSHNKKADVHHYNSILVINKSDI